MTGDHSHGHTLAYFAYLFSVTYTSVPALLPVIDLGSSFLAGSQSPRLVLQGSIEDSKMQPETIARSIVALAV